MKTRSFFALLLKAGTGALITTTLPGAITGHWKMDETTGLLAADSSSYNNHGTLANMVGNEWVNGTFGNALEFNVNADGDDRVNLPEMGINRLNDSFSIAMWVWADAIGPDYQMLAQNNSGSVYHAFEYDSYLRIETNANLLFQIEKAQGGGNGISLVGGTLIPGEWHHVAGVYDFAGESTTATLYLDGAIINQKTETVYDNANSAEDWRLGIAWNGVGYVQAFDGKLDDIGIWNQALTADQINYLRNNSIATFESEGQIPEPSQSSIICATLITLAIAFHRNVQNSLNKGTHKLSPQSSALP